MAKKETKSWKEERRKRAWALHQAGWKQKNIAEALGVTKGVQPISAVDNSRLFWPGRVLISLDTF